MANISKSLSEFPGSVQLLVKKNPGAAVNGVIFVLLIQLKPRSLMTLF